ncbi:MAG: PhnD/SsuA/transferrin family substrate-binding protein [Hydrogenothermaceae bacterium]|nr:PhnD/SsuA/transferrin family substrate-binding protein [Hydrogenothermaceae bacterium]
MKSIVLLLVLLIVYSSFGGTIKFAPLPTQPKEELIGGHLPLIRYLEQKTSLDFEIVYIEDYSKLLEEFKKGGVDIIIAGPIPYLELKSSFSEAKAILFLREKDGNTSYSCVLITAMDGPLSIKEIKGPVALPQRLSTCGYFSANILLSSEGKDINKLGYKHFSTHNQAIEAVIRGEYQVGSIKKSIAKEYEGFRIRILKESPKWSAFSMIVNSRTLNPEAINRIKTSLLSVTEKELKELVVGKFGFAECKEEDFEIIKKYEKYKAK